MKLEKTLFPLSYTRDQILTDVQSKDIELFLFI